MSTCDGPVRSTRLGTDSWPTESNGRFHSDWLSMMYPRLKLARNLLADDGVILISIDDNEIANSDEGLRRGLWRHEFHRATHLGERYARTTKAFSSDMTYALR